MTMTYAVELTADNFDRVTAYLFEKSDIPNQSELKITDHVILIQDVARRYREWRVLTPEKFAADWRFNNGFEYLYFKGISAV